MNMRNGSVFALYDISENCRAVNLARVGTTIQLLEEFATVNTPLRRYGYVIEGDIMNRPTVRIIWQRLYVKDTGSLLKFQRMLFIIF